MHSATTVRRMKAVGTFGGLALTCVLVLAACGGGSSATESVAPSAAASAVASAVAGDATSEPPRPTGMPDADWTELLAAMGTEEYRNKLLAKTPEELADSCTRPAMTPEDAQSAAENGMSAYPESSVEEWLAFYDYFTPQMQAVKDEVCASAPAVQSAPDAGAETMIVFDPPRPTGLPDSDWAAYLATWDPNDWQAQVNDWDEEIMVDFCAQDEATVREATIGGLPERDAEGYPESTIEEWTAFYDYAFASYEAVRQTACANY